MNVNEFLSRFPDLLATDMDQLADPAYRESIYRQLHPTPTPEFLPLIRILFQHEIAYRSDESNDGEYFENLYWAALFLYQIGDLDDVVPMWHAKQINMDTGGGFSIQFLVGRGLMETIEYLQQLDSLDTSEIIEHLNRCEMAGDFENLDAWLQSTIRYFA